MSAPRTLAETRISGLPGTVALAPHSWSRDLIRAQRSARSSEHDLRGQRFDHELGTRDVAEFPCSASGRTQTFRMLSEAKEAKLLARHQAKLSQAHAQGLRDGLPTPNPRLWARARRA